MAMDDQHLAEYEDAEGYDLENGVSGPDLRYYLDLAREVGGPGLDLACGTGFLTIPFATLGLAMTGADRAPKMLDLARRKALDLPIRWLHADCRTLDLHEQFRLVTLAGNGFQEFLTRQDQEGILGAARRHLAPDGLFAFETGFPRVADLVSTARPGGWSEEVPWEQYEDAQGRTVSVTTAQRHDALRQTVEYVTYQRWQEGVEEQFKTERTTLRLVYPQEMEALLHYNGFAIRNAYGDWDRQPLTADSPRMIYVCQLRH